MPHTGENSALHSWVAILRRRWPLVAATALFAIVAAGAAIATRSQTYQASAKLLIVPVSQDDQIYFGTGMFRDAGDPSLTASSAALILHSENVAAQAAVQLPGRTPQAILQDVQVRPTVETNVLAVAASGGSAADAVGLAKAYVRAIMTVRWRVVSLGLRRRIAVLKARPATSQPQIEPLRAALRGGSDPTVVVAQPTTPAIAAAQSPAGLILILGLAGGLFLGALVAFGADALSGRLRDADDACRAFRLSLWGEIVRLPRERRGDGPVAPSRMPSAGRAGYEALAARVARWAPAGESFALVSPSDRDGRTTTAVNLACALARQGRRTALLPLDTELDRKTVADLNAAGVQIFDEGPVPLRDALERARSAAELVVIDGPPVHRGINLVAPPIPTQLLLVVRIGHTRRQDLLAAREMLEEIGARPLAMVLIGTEAGGPGARTASAPARLGGAKRPATRTDEPAARASNGHKSWDPALRP